ncbi:hypothetical protein E2C01_049044 [Portunus trituberculatus]|uniref:Uncharacterized protein n=1 Tax=Portunus trituberculatus TaxID=210409 RepID=A0A5B7G4L5_PORTR|nr:hypothetical protein [Portunus trituberculatus]
MNVIQTRIRDRSTRRTYMVLLSRRQAQYSAQGVGDLAFGKCTRDIMFGADHRRLQRGSEEGRLLQAVLSDGLVISASPHHQRNPLMHLTHLTPIPPLTCPEHLQASRYL